MFVAWEAVRAATAEGENSPPGLGDWAEEECVLFQSDHGSGKGERPGEWRVWMEPELMGHICSPAQQSLTISQSS